MAQRGVGGLACVVVAGHAVIGLGVQGQQGGVRHGRAGVRADPGHAVVHAVVVVQVVQAQQELVLLANAEAVSACNPLLVDAAAGAIVVGFVVHRVQAQGRAFASLDVEVTRDAAVFVVAQRHVHLMLVQQQRLFVHLVDGTTGGATAEQHGSRSAQDFHAVVVEGIAVVEGGVADTVHKNVTSTLQREAAQADVFFAAFCSQEGDTTGVAQHVLHRVEVTVVDDLLGHHRDGLGDVAQFLVALADGGVRGAHRITSLGGFSGFLDGHGAQRLLLWRGLGLCPTAHRCGQHQGAQRQGGITGGDGRLHRCSHGDMRVSVCFFAGRTSGFSQDGLQIEHAARAGTGRLQEMAGYRFVRRKYMAHLLGRELGWPGMNGGKCNANASSSHCYVKLRSIFATNPTSSDPAMKKAGISRLLGEDVETSYLRCLPTRPASSNIVTCTLPKTSFSLASALIRRLFTLSCRPCFLM